MILKNVLLIYRNIKNVFILVGASVVAEFLKKMVRLLHINLNFDILVGAAVVAAFHKKY